MKKFRSTIVAITFVMLGSVWTKSGNVTFVTLGIYRRYCKNWPAR